MTHTIEKLYFSIGEVEEWKDIPDYEGLYQVSNFGVVKSLKFGKQRLLKPTLSGGYWSVGLCEDGKKRSFRIHQLVAVSFLNHMINGFKLVVNHIDFDKKNNHIQNLEIVTQRENSNQKHRKSSSEYVGVYWAKKRKKWKAQIRIGDKNKYLGSFNSELDASNAYQKKLHDLLISELVHEA